MILYSPAKINIGLQVIARRKDGFHDLQSVMYPVGLCDILEIRRSTNNAGPIRFGQSGILPDVSGALNLCVRAWELFNMEIPLPPVELHLHKQIPVGAGLGGGSSNASTTLKGLNMLAGNPLSGEKLMELAARLGSDCPFFLQEDPMMMEGRGELLSPISIDLEQWYLVLLFPGIHISTADAYAGIEPAIPARHLRHLIREPMENWSRTVSNDFENTAFALHPELNRLKKELYRAGAIYASLSGSGSALYGLFKETPELSPDLEVFSIWKGRAISHPVPI